MKVGVLDCNVRNVLLFVDHRFVILQKYYISTLLWSSVLVGQTSTHLLLSRPIQQPGLPDGVLGEQKDEPSEWTKNTEWVSSSGTEYIGSNCR